MKVLYFTIHIHTQINQYVVISDFPPNTGAINTSIAPAGSHTAVYGSAENFIGRVRVDPLFNADNDIRVSAAYVTFEPGARSAWHTHPAGQRLIVTSGVGLTQQEGKPVQVIRAGDVISCPADVKHWHGAAPGSAMTHLAITGMVDGKSVNWKELVTDEQYHAH
ncbi:hypothetical protein AF56_04536 [Escherichia coli BIDMC 83]|nr:hypothetical protein AF56_04536 [Escherichia coli BIDMC 83]